MHESALLASVKAKVGESLKAGIFTASLGQATHHGIALKLKACAEAGFDGVEIAYQDLKHEAKDLEAHDLELTFEDALLQAAENIRSHCDDNHLTVINLQPFKNYDGLVSTTRHYEKISKFHTWLKICKILNTELIIVPSMFHSDPTVSTGTYTPDICWGLRGISMAPF